MQSINVFSCSYKHKYISIASEYHWTASSCSSYEHAQVSDARTHARTRACACACTHIRTQRMHAPSHTFDTHTRTHARMHALRLIHATRTHTPIRQRAHAHMHIHALSIPPSLHKHSHPTPLTAPELAHVATHSASPRTYKAAACAHARISWRARESRPATTYSPAYSLALPV
jgi:hypothetical protein